NSLSSRFNKCTGISAWTQKSMLCGTPCGVRRHGCRRSFFSTAHWSDDSLVIAGMPTLTSLKSLLWERLTACDDKDVVAPFFGCSLER
ncbi:MAG: hypothetical protein K2F78_04075, partial [Muribaculaceae bacterium]|nr:hypothetical protein [Muribaculaceae bacterium]